MISGECVLFGVFILFSLLMAVNGMKLYAIRKAREQGEDIKIKWW